VASAQVQTAGRTVQRVRLRRRQRTLLVAVVAVVLVVRAAVAVER
jgi:hypothetical protein